MFSVTTETDHVAPWRSVYKILLLNQGDITLVLTSGGHNAGIVSEPGHPSRHYQPRRGRKPRSLCGAGGLEGRSGRRMSGSWWPGIGWRGWMSGRGTYFRTATFAEPEKGYPALADAPGTYVREA